MGWSPLGKKEGELRMSHQIFLIWCKHVRKAKPVLVLHECTQTLPWEMLEFWFSDLYTLRECLASPVQMGHPIRRWGRRYTWMIRKDYEFVGNVEIFESMLAATTIATADVFFVAPRDELEEELARVAARRGCNPDMVNVDSDWSFYYTPGQKRRMRKHMLEVPFKPTQRLVGKQTCPPSTFVYNPDIMVADLDQNEGFGPSPGVAIPTLVTHGLLHNFLKQRPLTAKEHLLCMGFPVYENVPGYPLPFQTVVDSMPPPKKKKCAGNSMYVPLIGRQLIYLLSNLQRKGNLQTPTRKLRRRDSMSTKASKDSWTFKGDGEAGVSHSCSFSSISSPSAFS